MGLVQRQFIPSDQLMLASTLQTLELHKLAKLQPQP